MAARKNAKAARNAVPQDGPKGSALVVPIPDTDDDDAAYQLLAQNVPEWGELDCDDRAEILRLVRRQRERGRSVKMRLTRKPDGGWRADPAGPSEVLGLLKVLEAFATTSNDVVNARANELMGYLGSVGADDEGRYNAALSFLSDMKPESQAEALLLTQMYVTHDAAIRAMRQLGECPTLDGVQMYGNLANKLLRTSQGQMETLARMRRNGEQVVRHIHVNEGGQAVIAENVNVGAIGKQKGGDQCHAAAAISGGAAVFGADPFGNGVPGAGGERPEAMPHARRVRRGARGK